MMQKMTRRLVLAAAMLAAGALWTGDAFAVSQTNGEYNTLFAGIGAKGYDPVAYHTVGKATPGSDKITHDWKGVTWRFASEENKKLFAANPEKYAPQYGGFCSWGVANGRLFDVDPVNGWKIVDGKLYMNFNADILKAWEKDIPGFIQKAQASWPKLNK